MREQKQVMIDNSRGAVVDNDTLNSSQSLLDKTYTSYSIEPSFVSSPYHIPRKKEEEMKRVFGSCKACYLTFEKLKTGM